ncbi:MAG: signal peptidase II [Pseudomonadota bacterium]
MRKLTRLGLIAAILIGCVGCDQLSKHAVRTHLELGYSESFLGDTLRLTHAENPGAFLSVGANLAAPARIAVFQVGVGIIVLGLLLYALLARNLGRWTVAALALLAASGLGNLIDRLAFDGRVTDFLNMGIHSLRTGIFNIADVVGVVGVVILLCASGSSRETPQATNA